MDDALIVELFYEYDTERKDEKSEHADRFCADVHRHYRHYRRKADLPGDKLGFDYLTYHEYDGVNDYKPDTHRYLTADKAVYGPRDKDGTGAENGDDVYYCDYERD